MATRLTGPISSMRACKGVTCAATASQSVAAPLAAISSGVKVWTLAGPSSAKVMVMHSLRMVSRST